MALSSYVSLSEAKTWLRIDSSDSIQDDEINAAAAAATAMLANYLGWDAALGSSTESIIGGGGSFLFPKRKNISAVASCLDSLGVAVPTAFDLIAISRTDGQWFGRDATYTVTYTAGYDTASVEFAPVKVACKQALGAIYNSHAYDPNLAGEQMQGVFMGMFGPQGLGALPPGARNMVEHLRRRL